jgi:predicted DNA-binding protein (MmcQ/YjbR family)
MTAQTNKRRERIMELCLALPEGTSTSSGDHVQFQVRGKTFAYYLSDHHGDGVVALCCKAAPGDQDLLFRLDPKRYLVPAYLGARGWVSLRVDMPTIDWDEVAELATNSYRLVARKKLAAQVAALTPVR